MLRRLKVFIFALLISQPAFFEACAVEDGFGFAKVIESKYFTVYYPPELDVSGLAQKLNISASDMFLAGKPVKKGLSSEAGLADMLDALFTQVSDILDMHIYSFRGNIKICRDFAQLKQVYKNFTNQELQAQSFYAYSVNTVYISADSFERGIIGHEVAHAVISKYFVVLPPEKIQEILSMYVDYELHKPTAK